MKGTNAKSDEIDEDTLVVDQGSEGIVRLLGCTDNYGNLFRNERESEGSEGESLIVLLATAT